MLKTGLTIAALALVVQAVQLPAAYAGAQGVILHGGTAGGSGNPWCCKNGGLPVHNGGGADVKNNGGGMTGTGMSGLTPQLVWPPHITLKRNGGFPRGPLPYANHTF